MATVLIIDDDELFRGTVRAILETAGHQVLEAPDGMADRDVRIEADVVLLDVRMPKADGYAVLEWLRRLVAVPVVLTTGGESYGGRRAADVAAEFGAAFLPKPFGTVQLLAAVARATEHRPLPRGLVTRG